MLLCSLSWFFPLFPAPHPRGRSRKAIETKVIETKAIVNPPHENQRQQAHDIDLNHERMLMFSIDLTGVFRDLPNHLQYIVVGFLLGLLCGIFTSKHFWTWLTNCRIRKEKRKSKNHKAQLLDSMPLESRGMYRVYQDTPHCRYCAEQTGERVPLTPLDDGNFICPSCRARVELRRKRRW